jgi:hypothetical protein
MSEQMSTSYIPKRKVSQELLLGGHGNSLGLKHVASLSPDQAHVFRNSKRLRSARRLSGSSLQAFGLVSDNGLQPEVDEAEAHASSVCKASLHQWTPLLCLGDHSKAGRHIDN